MNFAQTTHCRSHVHCRSCRQDATFRASLEAAFGPIVCPLGLPLGATEGFPAAAIAPAAPPRPRCQYEEDTGIKVEGQPCRCNWIVCRNPAAPICGESRVWWAAKCRPDRCRFFTAAPAAAIAKE